MTAQTILDVMQRSKELWDIRTDYEKTSMLFDSMNWQELQAHLEKIHQKYFVELTVYNFFSFVPPHQPQSLIQETINCMDFLQKWAMSKYGEGIVELINKWQ